MLAKDNGSIVIMAAEGAASRVLVPVPTGFKLWGGPSALRRLSVGVGSHWHDCLVDILS
jgi:hypothetical protein